MWRAKTNLEGAEKDLDQQYETRPGDAIWPLPVGRHGIFYYCQGASNVERNGE